MRRFVYYIRRHKHLRRFCKLLLNLLILSLLGFLIWFGILLFTRQLEQGPLIGSLIFIAASVVFIWLCRIGLRNNWQPSMKITVVSLVCLFFVTAFAGVQPMAKYKDIIIDGVRGYYNEHQPSSEDSTSPPDLITDVAYEEIYNQFRQENGLQSLVFTDDLNRVAALRVEEIKSEFSHHSEGNYNLHLGENIAMSTGFLSDAGAFNMWENSSGHRANMLDSNYIYTGYANDSRYAVQVFSQFNTINGVPQLPPGWYWDE